MGSIVCDTMASGKLVVRMPPELHRQLGAAAESEGVSLNQLIVALLAGGVGFKLVTGGASSGGPVAPAGTVPG
jgi:hypothetical protein